MNLRDSLLESLDEQRRNLLELPPEVEEAISGIIEDIQSDRIDGKAPVKDWYGGYINVIPSKTKGSCTSLLITYCYNKDSFENRIIESLDHASVLCPGICKRVYFLTTQWNSSVANKLFGYTESVRKSNVEIFFIHITAKGIVLMPI